MIRNMGVEPVEQINRFFYRFSVKWRIFPYVLHVWKHKFYFIILDYKSIMCMNFTLKSLTCEIKNIFETTFWWSGVFETTFWWSESKVALFSCADICITRCMRELNKTLIFVTNLIHPLKKVPSIGEMSIEYNPLRFL